MGSAWSADAIGTPTPFAIVIRPPMIRSLAAELHAAKTIALERLATWLQCLPRRCQPNESEGAYRGRLVHAIMRDEKGRERLHTKRNP